eukprot:6194000-Pleurochrysis_carterae.AAC.1
MHIFQLVFTSFLISLSRSLSAILLNLHSSPLSLSRFPPPFSTSAPLPGGAAALACLPLTPVAVRPEQLCPERILQDTARPRRRPLQMSFPGSDKESNKTSLELTSGYSVHDDAGSADESQTSSSESVEPLRPPHDVCHAAADDPVRYFADVLLFPVSEYAPPSTFKVPPVNATPAQKKATWPATATFFMRRLYIIDVYS